MTTLSFPISKIVNGTLLHLRTTASGSLTPDSPHPRYSPPRPPHPTTFHSRYQRLHLPLSAEHVVLHPQLAHSPVIASRAMDSPRTQSTLSNSPLPPLPHRRVSNPLRYSSEHSHPLSPPRRNDIGGGSGSSSARRDADITVPEWQPDAAAKQCPICTSAFTFFNRRHHCRYSPFAPLLPMGLSKTVNVAVSSAPPAPRTASRSPPLT
jgi:hypothetical protein